MVRSMFRQRKKKQQNRSNESFSIELFKELKANIENLHQMLDSPGDLNVREFTVGEADTKCAIVYIDGLIDRNLVQNTLLENLQGKMRYQKAANRTEFLDKIYQEFISISKFHFIKVCFPPNSLSQ